MTHSCVCAVLCPEIQDFFDELPWLLLLLKRIQQ